MKRRFTNNYKSLLKGVEREIMLKDLEIAKSLEINLKNKNIPLNKPAKMTPQIRSDLPKE